MANMIECRNLTAEAKKNHREYLRTRRWAATFSVGPARDRMFLIAGEYRATARMYMRQARSNHTDYLSARYRRICQEAA